MSDNEAPNVTFVGGKAIEQHETLDSNLDGDEREAAKEAVRKAIQEAGESSASEAKEGKAKDPYRPAGAVSTPDPEPPQRGADGKFLPRDGDTSKSKAKTDTEKADKEESHDDELDLDKATVKQLLKAREKVAAIKRDAKDELSKARAQFAQEQAQFQRQQAELQQYHRELQRQQKALQDLRSDPARAIREVGYDPEQFILDLAQEGTPEGAARRKQQEVDNQLNEIRQWRQEQARQQQQYEQQRQHQQIVQARQSAVQEFTKLGTDEEKYPHVANFYKGRERVLVADGDLAAEEYRSLSGGKEGSYADILDYIEDQLAERAQSWYTKRGGSSQKNTASPQPSPKANSKGKNLSPGNSGERRTLQAKDLSDLDGDERLEAAKQAVAIALANSK